MCVAFSTCACSFRANMQTLFIYLFVSMNATLCGWICIDFHKQSHGPEVHWSKDGRIYNLSQSNRCKDANREVKVMSANIDRIISVFSASWAIPPYMTMSYWCAYIQSGSISMAFLLRSERLGMGWLSVLEELCVMYMSLSKVLEAVKMRKKQGKQWV